MATNVLPPLVFGMEALEKVGLGRERTRLLVMPVSTANTCVIGVSAFLVTPSHSDTHSFRLY